MIKNRIWICISLLVVVLLSCDKTKETTNTTTNQTQGELIEENDTANLNDNVAQDLIERGIEDYTSIEASITDQSKIANGKTLYLLNSMEFPNLESLRNKLVTSFSTKNVDEMLNYYCAIQDPSGVYVCSHSDDDVNSLFEDFNVKSVNYLNSNTADVNIILQIGESGQTDNRVVNFTKSDNKWQITNNPFITSDQAETGAADSLKSIIK